MKWVYHIKFCHNAFQTSVVKEINQATKPNGLLTDAQAECSDGHLRTDEIYVCAVQLSGTQGAALVRGCAPHTWVTEHLLLTLDTRCAESHSSEHVKNKLNYCVICSLNNLISSNPIRK